MNASQMKSAWLMLEAISNEEEYDIVLDKNQIKEKFREE